MKLFNLLLNILWLIFCGIWMAIGYTVAALVCFILIVTIPFGIASLRIAGFVLWPFGRTTVERRDAGAPSFVGNVIWVIFAGWWLALGHLITSIPLFLSIIGIPFGWANLKLIPVSLMPLGREIVPTDQQFGGR
ncbi:YccF domain-containing protein [Streptomyces sp. NPDC059866]|uniref:YccF domain-containing protein n=1 Tax=Streptomyces sp. NPDC059866 TaxID=3346978 RepID=UPI003668F555